MARHSDRASSTQRWAAFVALLMSNKVQAASTFYQRPRSSNTNNYQLAWQDNSSTDNNSNYYHYYRNNNNKNRFSSSSSPPLYFSEDEYEERILSALARLSDESDNNDDDDDQEEMTQQGDCSIYSSLDSEEEEEEEGANSRRYKSSRSRRQMTKVHNDFPPPESTGKTTTAAAIHKKDDTPGKVQPPTTQIQNSVQEETTTEPITRETPQHVLQPNQNSATASTPTPTHPHGPYGYSRPYISSNTLEFPDKKSGQEQEQQSSQSVPQSTIIHSSRGASSQSRSSNGHKIIKSATKQQQAAPAPTTTTTTATIMDNNNSMITPWIKTFLSGRPKDALLPVPRDYLLDNFNLVRLAPVVEKLASMKQRQQTLSPNLEQQKEQIPAAQHTTTNNSQQQHPYAIYRAALDLILRQEEPEEEPSLTVQYAAEVLYCLVHARFAASPRGLDTIRRRLVLHGANNKSPLFGRCPKLQCGGMPLLPCGLSDDYDDDCSTTSDDNSVSSSSSSSSSSKSSRAKRYCCNCLETMHCWESKVDQSAWGTSVCHLLLMVYGKEELFPSHFMAAPYSYSNSGSTGSDHPAITTPDGSQNYGRIFGFPVHPSVLKSVAAKEQNKV